MESTFSHAGVDATDPTLPGGLGAAGDEPPLVLERGATLGRYVVLDRIGAGAMGVVFAAWDPGLDRKLAIKLLHGDVRDEGLAERRLVREGQALARLHHPHVVAVHDVGVHDGAVFVAMEYVAGESLRSWAESRRRSWREVVDAYRQAALGLAAAHEVGLVHRDFKPDNAIIDARGHVRVLDFGLARAAGDLASSTELPATDAPVDEATTGSALAEGLTRHGALLGTPAYMSPEQLRGQPVDGRSDQFSFCVALFEALYGERPFHGANLPALMLDIGRGHPRTVARRGVPGWLQRLVLRGLAPRPDDRHASMAVIARELARAPRTRWLVAAAASTAVGVVALVRLRPDETCTGAAEHVADAFDRAAIVSGLGATAVPYAGATAASVVAALDDYSARWIAAHEDACRATHVRHEQSLELLDRRMACLDDRRVAMVALADLLVHADAAAVEHAIAATQQLPAIEACADLQRLLANAPPPSDPETRALFDQARAGVARASAAEIVAAYERGLADADESLLIARTIEHDALAAEAGIVRARLLDGAGRNVESAAALREAEYRARRSGDELLAARAEVEAVFVVGYRLARIDEGKWWAEHARGAVEHGRDGVLAARLDNHHGVLLHLAGDTAAGLEHLARALEARRRLLGDRHLDVAESHYNLAIALRAAGRRDDARAHHEQALALRIDVLGRDHPLVAESRSALGVVAKDDGDLDGAIAAWHEAERIQRAAYGGAHPKLAATLNNLGGAELMRAHPVEAEAYYRAALAMLERTVGPDDLQVDRILYNLGELLRERGDLAGAQTMLQRALAGRERRLGPVHRDVALALTGLARVHVQLGERTQADTELARAVAILEKGDDALALARARLRLGLLHDDRDAVVRARDVLASSPSDRNAVAEADAWLARK